MKNEKMKQVMLFGVGLILLTILCYHDFIFGDRLFVSMSTASDSYGQTYPTYISEARIFDKIGFASYIRFTTGLGIRSSNFDWLNLYNIPIYGGENNVANIMLLEHLVSIIIAGISFYGVVRLRGKSTCIATISGLFYAFCGPILVRQLWNGYVYEYALFALWLWSFERLYSKKDIRFLPFATFALFNHLHLNMIYYPIIGGYIVFRLLWDDKLRKYWKYVAGLCIVTCLFAFLTGKVDSVIDQIERAFSSRRMQASVGGNEPFLQLLERSGWFWGSTKELTTLFTRIIGTDTPTTPGLYAGELNYLEGPALYCGIITVLCLIPIIVVISNRRRILTCVTIILECAYIFINPLRFISNGMVKDTFKLTSFWITVLTLFIFAEGFDELRDRIEKKHIVIVLIETIAINLIGLYCIFETRHEKDNIFFAILFAYIYLVLFCLLYIKKNTNNTYVLFSYIVVIVCIMEVIVQARLCIGKIETITKETVTDRVGYNDYTLEALEYIYTEDPRRDYRIDKQYRSFGYCDADAQDYYSATFYIGGTGFGEKTADLYESMSVPDADGIYNSVYPPSMNTYFNTWIGTKYVISNNPIIVNYGYEPIWNENDIYVYENKKCIPLGYVCDKYILKEDFDRLGYNEKNTAIMNAVILENKPDDEIDDCLQHYAIDKEENLYDRYERVNVSTDDSGYYLLEDSLNDKEVLLIAVTNGDKTVYDGIIEFVGAENTKDYYIRMDGGENYVFEATYNGIDGFRLLNNSKNDSLHVSSLEVYKASKEEYYKEYDKAVSEINSRSLKTSFFNEIKMCGDVYSPSGGMLVVPIISGDVDDIRVDGTSVPVHEVNYSLTGCVVPEGEHSVEIIYGKSSNGIPGPSNYKNLRRLICCVLWMMLLTIIYAIIDYKEKTGHLVTK